jgi:tetrahydromethanopterin S-methyltransferase subunit B
MSEETKDKILQLDEGLVALDQDLTRLEDRVGEVLARVAKLEEQLVTIAQACEKAMQERKTSRASKPARRRTTAPPGKVTDKLKGNIMGAVEHGSLQQTFRRAEVIQMFRCSPPHATRALADLVDGGKLRLDGVKGGAKYVVVG